MNKSDNLKLSKLKFDNIKLMILDFDGVLTDNRVMISEEGNEFVLCSRFDGIGIKKLKDIGIITIIVSTEKNPVVSARAKKLNISCYQSIDNKGECIEKIMKEFKVNSKQVVYLGNDENDISAFEKVDYPIGVSDVWKTAVRYCIALTTIKGGHGAVRELCDKIYDDYQKDKKN